MKKLYATLIASLIVGVSIAQNDDFFGAATLLPSQVERSPLLEQLYEESAALEEDGTMEEVRANRLAIKAAWQQINPEIAALYKPVDATTYRQIGYNGEPYVPDEIKVRPAIMPTRDWTTDLLIRDDFIDGLDMDVDGAGNIYLVAYENEIDAGGAEDQILIYRSTDNGASFDLWQQEVAVSPIRKIKVISFDGAGDDYLLIYLMFENGLLQVIRFGVDTGTFNLQNISGGISDFDVDRNYPGNTNAQRAFATYLKDDGCETRVKSARSTAGNYGLDWVDEVQVETPICGREVAFGYGRNGGCYTTFTGVNSGDLYTAVNTSSNDPASWQNWSVIESGADQEVTDISIKATRKSPANDEVLILSSARPTGSTDGYNHRSYRRLNGSGFTELFTGIALPGESVGPMDMWIRRVNDTEIIQATRIRDYLDNTNNDGLYERSYDGDGFFNNGVIQISDPENDVWEGFASAIAETGDDLPCVAWAGNNAGFAYGLYFDNAAGVFLNTEDAVIEGLRYFPNPVDEVLTISTENPVDQIELFDVLGRSVNLVFPAVREVQLSTSHLQSGVYIMKIKSDNKIGTYKIVKR